MSEVNKELAGFYRDPVTGKYYRDQHGGSSNPALKKLKIKRELNEEEFKIMPKITNVARYLKAREIRTIGGMQESKEYLKMRLYLKQHIQNTNLDNLRRKFNFTSVDYITGSKHSIYGLWNNEKCQKYTIGTMKFEEHSFNDLYFHNALGFVIDMCEGLRNDFIVVYNPSCCNGLLVERVDEYTRVPILRYQQRFASRNLEHFKRQIFCCSCNKNNLFHAFGCENAVAFLDIHNRETFYKIDGRVHTVAFDDTGYLMVSGVHTGRVFFHDLRIKEMVMNLEVSKSCLIDSSMLNSYVIVAGADDVLCSIDMRKREVVTEFLTHKQQGIKKEPFSIASNMLCALASDNRIRIWDLSGGFPIHKIKPLENPQNNIKGWLCNIGNKTHLYYFEGAVKKVFEIM